MNKLSFGTYLLNGSNLIECLRSAYSLGFRHFDTAKLYKNEDIIGTCFDDIINLKEEVWITTKIFDRKLKNIDTVIDIIKHRVKLLNPSSNKKIKIRLLLHHTHQSRMCKYLEILLSKHISKSFHILDWCGWCKSSLILIFLFEDGFKSLTLCLIISITVSIFFSFLSKIFVVIQTSSFRLIISSKQVPIISSFL